MAVADVFEECVIPHMVKRVTAADVRELLAECHLTEYAEAFVENGYDNVEFILCEMSDDDIEAMLTDVGMTNIGHRRHFVSWFVQHAPTSELDDGLNGQRVRLTGLSRDDLNGRVGTVVSLDRAKGRYIVKLAKLNDETGEVTRVTVLPSRLQLLAAPAPDDAAAAAT